MCGASQHNGRPPRPHTRAVVVQLFPPFVRQRFALDPDSRGVDVQRHFEDQEAPVHRPGFQTRKSTRVDEMTQVLDEARHTFALCRHR